MNVCSMQNFARMVSSLFGEQTTTQVSKLPYTISCNELGSGYYGDVYLGEHTETGTPVAIKRVRKRVSRKMKLRIQNEIDCLNITKRAPHPNIVKMHEVYEDYHHIWIVMELCEGEELYETVKRVECFNEHDVRILMREILQALVHLKNHGIVHRDLKPENIMVKIDNDGTLRSLKLIDFGLSCAHSQRHRSRVGTAYYMAPEVIRKDYDERCDEWSCGVILYILLCGFPPFNGLTDADIMNRVQEGTFTFPAPMWDNISDDAKDLVSRLLTFEADERMTAEDALDHVWFHNNHTKKK